MTTTAQTVSLEAFLAAFSTAPEARKKAAMDILSGKAPEQATEIYLTARQVAQRYNLDEATVWRWQFPSVSWGGIKRYKVSDCEAYLISDKLTARRAELAVERANKRKHKSTQNTTPLNQ